MWHLIGTDYEMSWNVYDSFEPNERSNIYYEWDTTFMSQSIIHEENNNETVIVVKEA